MIGTRDHQGVEAGYHASTISGIRVKFIAIFLLIGLLPVLASGWFTIWQSEQGLIQVEATRLKTTVEDNRELIDQWLYARMAEMRELAALPETAAFDRGVLFLKLLDLTSDMPYYESIYLLLPSGEGQFGVEVQQATGSARAASAINVGDQPWFKRVISGEDTFPDRSYREIPFRPRKSTSSVSQRRSTQAGRLSAPFLETSGSIPSLSGSSK